MKKTKSLALAFSLLMLKKSWAGFTSRKEDYSQGGPLPTLFVWIMNHHILSNNTADCTPEKILEIHTCCDLHASHPNVALTYSSTIADFDPEEVEWRLFHLHKNQGSQSIFRHFCACAPDSNKERDGNCFPHMWPQLCSVSLISVFSSRNILCFDISRPNRRERTCCRCSALLDFFVQTNILIQKELGHGHFLHHPGKEIVQPEVTPPPLPQEETTWKSELGQARETHAFWVSVCEAKWHKEALYLTSQTVKTSSFGCWFKRSQPCSAFWEGPRIPLSVDGAAKDWMLSSLGNVKRAGVGFFSRRQLQAPCGFLTMTNSEAE